MSPIYKGRRGIASRVNRVNFTLNRIPGELAGYRFSIAGPRQPGVVIIVPPDTPASWRFQFLTHLFSHTKADL